MTTSSAGSSGISAADARSYDEYARQFRPARPGAGLAVIGLLLSLAADVSGIISSPWTAIDNRPSDALYVLAAVGALVGLLARSEQRPPDCFVLGVWLIALPSFVGILLSASAYPIAQTGKAPIVSDLLGIMAVVFLLASIARNADRIARPSRATLSASILLSVLVGTGLYLGRIISISHEVSLLAPACIAFILTTLVVVNALRLRSRVMGAGVLLGWLATLILGRITGSSGYLWRRSLLSLANQGQGFGYSPAYTYAVFILFLGAALVIAYVVRKDRSPVN